MSVLTSFIEQHLISTLEAALVAHEPELQSVFLNEMKALADKAHDWINDKLILHAIPTGLPPK